MKLDEVLISQLEEGYTLKKMSMTKWADPEDLELDSSEGSDSWASDDERWLNDDNEPGGRYGWASVKRASKGSRKVYSIIDTKTNKEVGKAELSSNDARRDGSLTGTFLGKRFSFELDGVNPQTKFNRFVKWPSTKKKYGKLLESNNEKIYLKVDDPNKQTGMPGGWNLVRSITKEDDKFYVETKQKGYGVFFNKDKNTHKLRLGSQSGQPITILSAYEIISRKK